MTDEQEAYFLLGAIYAMAQQAKENKVYTDCSVSEIARIFLRDFVETEKRKKK